MHKRAVMCILIGAVSLLVSNQAMAQSVEPDEPPDEGGATHLPTNSEEPEPEPEPSGGNLGESSAEEKSAVIAQGVTHLVVEIDLPADKAANVDERADLGEEPATGWTEPECVDAGLESLSVEEADRLAQEQADREQELLDASSFGRSISAAVAAADESSEDDEDTSDSEGGESGDAEAGSPDEDCLRFYCFTERIEDVRLGHLSNEPDGAYFEFINSVGGAIDALSSIVPSVSAVAEPTDRDQLSDLILDTALGEPASPNLMAVFRYCRRSDTDEIERIDPTYGPSFAWGTTIEAEFDIDGSRGESTETLRTLILASKPDMGTTPPVERGYTFVQLPMWFWVNEPFVGETVHAISDAGTTMLATRATLVDVTWKLGDATLVCTPADMQEFVHGTTSVLTHTTECGHRFTELQSYTMTATARYFIEERILRKDSVNDPWPDTPWQPHPDPAAQYATVTSTSGPIDVVEIRSVNVDPNATQEELQAHARRIYENTSATTSLFEQANDQATQLGNN